MRRTKGDSRRDLRLIVRKEGVGLNLVKGEPVLKGDMF